MFSKKILETDDFLSQTAGARLLYISLCMSADDEGFLNNAVTVIRMSGCSEDDLEELIQNGYVLPVIAKVYVITHWYIHNTIPKDRFHSTIIIDWKRYLSLENKIYRIKGRIQ